MKRWTWFAFRALATASGLVLCVSLFCYLRFFFTAPTTRTRPDQVAIPARGHRTLYATPALWRACRVWVALDIPAASVLGSWGYVRWKQRRRNRP